LKVSSSTPDSLRAASNSARALLRALKSIIWTRLSTLTAPSPVVSMGRKMASGQRWVTTDCTPSDPPCLAPIRFV
jgi:hypothetical protein